MGLSVKVNKIVNGFSLDAEWTIGNELAVLFGYSGAGKSLTLQIIAGLLSPDHGFIQLNERTFFDSSTNRNLPPQARSCGYVFQDLALFPHMTIRENILYGAHRLSKTVREQQAGEMIEKFRITGLKKNILRRYRVVRNSVLRSHAHLSESRKHCFLMNPFPLLIIRSGQRCSISLRRSTKSFQSP